MKLIPLEQAKPGDVIAKNVYDFNGTMLLSRGVVLQQKYIDKLASMGYLMVYIEDEMLSDVQMEEVVSEDKRRKTVVAVRESFQKIEESKANERFDKETKKAKEAIDSIIDDLIDKKNVLISLIDLKSYDDYLYTHSVNVCILSGMIAMGMKLPMNKVRCIMLGALFHDVGRIKIDKKIWNKAGRLTEEEMNLVKTHPEVGYEICTKYGILTAVEGMAVLQHHEKLDGSGYPDGRTEEEIHLFGKIVALADVYDALTTDRPFRKRLRVHEALEYINSMKGVFFYREAVESLKSFIAPYPIGIIVMLNTGERAFVIKENVKAPLRPVIRVFNDGKSLKIGHICDIDLSIEPNKKIVRVL